MRNRFKPNLNNSRAARSSSLSTNQSSAGDNAASSGLTANLQAQDSLKEGVEDEAAGSEATKKNQGNPTTHFKTPASEPVSGPSRRSRIKPAVVPVARARGKVTKEGSQQQSKDGKETDSCDLRDHSLSGKEDQFSANDPQNKEEGKVAKESLKCSSLKERNQETSVPCVVSPSVKNKHQTSQDGAQESMQKQSQPVNDNTNSENITTQANGDVGPPSLPRRKRVLPNLGSASRRRHSSVSKETVERSQDIPEVQKEEVVTSEKDVSYSTGQRSEGSSGNRSEGSETLPEEQKCPEPSPLPLTMASDVHDKNVDDDEVEPEDSIKRKGVKRKRDRRSHKPKEPSDPSQMTMQHLIYYNPKTNPMTSSLAGKKKKGGINGNKKGNDNEKGDSETDGVNVSSVAGSPTPATPSENSKDTSVVEDDTDGEAVAPRVKLDAEGNIILDEESLLIPKETDKSVETSEVVYEDADEVNYGTYLKRRKVMRWSLEETQTFYKALSQVGTDFGLMLPLFPGRKRRELKAKFKREEKLHRDLVDKALCVRNPIEVELFTPKVEGEEIDDDLLNTENGNSVQQNDIGEPESVGE